uniref:Uncharacterized protein n=1 Tax=Tupiella akineta TaxID=160070 RepID=Q6UVP4_TUPAK|nr:hypothetical protein PsakpMp67 [Tupiella akineta]AAQ18780.1 hypothetical protein [Tupiella akineta]
MRGSLRKLRQFVRKLTNFGGSKICSFHSQTAAKGCGNLFVDGKPTSGAAQNAREPSQTTAGKGGQVCFTAGKDAQLCILCKVW